MAPDIGPVMPFSREKNKKENFLNPIDKTAKMMYNSIKDPKTYIGGKRIESKRDYQGSNDSR